VTEKSVTSARELREQVERGRKRGYWLVEGENSRDLAAIAAPVRIGGEVFAVVLGGPPQRFRGPALARQVARLLRACAEIDAATGGAKPARARGGRR